MDLKIDSLHIFLFISLIHPRWIFGDPTIASPFTLDAFYITGSYHIHLYRIINPGDRLILGAMSREAHNRSGCAKSPRSYAMSRLLRVGSSRNVRERFISPSPSTGEDKGEDHPLEGSIGRIEYRRPSVVASAETRPGLLSTYYTTHAYTYLRIRNYIVVAPRDRRPIAALTSQLFR